MKREALAAYAALGLGLGLGIIGDGWVRDGRAGLGVLLYGLMVLGALAAVVWLAGLQLLTRNLWCLPLFVLAVAMPWLRDEPVLVFWCLVAAWGLLVLLAQAGVSGAIDRWNLLDYLVAGIEGCFSAWARPFAPLGRLLAACPRRARVGRGAAPVLRGMLLAAPVLVAFTALLASADVVFGTYVERITRLDLGIDFRWLLGHTVVVLLIGWPIAGGLLHTVRPGHASLADLVAALGPPRQAAGEGATSAGEDTAEAAHSGAAREGQRSQTPGPRLGFVEAAVVLATVDALFLAFVVIQAAYLFGGRDTLEISGLTYAEYARRGFFELLAVAALALPLVAALDALTVRTSLRQRVGFLALAATVVLCNVVILASAMQRLLLYEDAYGWTATRLHSHAFMVWLAALCVLLLAVLLAEQRRWLLFGTLLSALVALLGFGLLDPDQFIAEQNLGRYLVGRPLDAAHLTSLSADATPAVLRAYDAASARGDEQIRTVLGQHLRGRLIELDCAATAPWHTRNLSRAGAHALLDARRAELESHLAPYRYHAPVNCAS